MGISRNPRSAYFSNRPLTPGYTTMSKSLEGGNRDFNARLGLFPDACSTASSPAFLTAPHILTPCGLPYPSPFGSGPTAGPSTGPSASSKSLEGGNCDFNVSLIDDRVGKSLKAKDLTRTHFRKPTYICKMLAKDAKDVKSLRKTRNCCERRF